MPLVFEIECPKCHARYQAVKAIWDEGSEALMYCPNCTHKFPRKEGKIVSTNFPSEMVTPPAK